MIYISRSQTTAKRPDNSDNVRNFVRYERNGDVFGAINSADCLLSACKHVSKSLSLTRWYLRVGD